MYKKKKEDVVGIVKRKIKIMMLLLLVFIFSSTIEVYAIGSYTINGVTVRYTDFSSSPNECWVYANNIYKKIWRTNFTYAFSSNDNMLRNLSDGELTLTVNHLKSYVSNASLGSCLRICNSEYLHGSDGWGHSQIIVQKDMNGFAVLEGGLSASPYCREKYYTWSEYCNAGWLGGTYQYIKYIKWPGAPAYSQNTEPLSISNVRVSDVNSNSYKVSCNIAGNVTKVLFPTWPSADDSGNPIWHEGTISGNTASCVIRRSDHGNKTGDYISHIYIYDSAGNSISAAAPLVVMGDTQAPVISDIRVSEIKMDSFTVTCKVYDNGGVASVKFPTWPSADDSGNPIWHEGTINGDTASCVIKKSEHGNKTGLYLTHIYAYDMNGNMTAGRAPGVIIGDTEPPVIDNIKIIDVTEESYTITCTVKDNNSSGAISVRFPTWPSADDSGNPIWHEGKINGDTASCVIKKREHGNKTGTYISHIYAYDVVGNSSSAAAPAIELGKKHQHVYTSSIKKPATCTEPGIRLYTCKDNDDSYEEEISATGHQHTELRNVKAATYEQEGYTGDTYCTICNQKISSGNTIAKLSPQTVTPGKTIKDNSTNGVYKVLKDGMSVEFTKPIYRNASVRIPDTIIVNGITYKVTGISANAFKNNKSLKSVSIGRNVTVIGTNAFYGCKKLSKVSGGNGIVKIGHRAFANCSSLSEITIPESVRSIGKQAFCNCKKLRSITIKTSMLSGKTVGSKAFAGTYKNPTVKVPAKQLKAYEKLLKARGMSSKTVYRK